MPAFGGECEDELLLYTTDTAHYCDDAIMDLQVVTQEWHHKETFQTDVETLKQKKIFLHIVKPQVDTYVKASKVCILSDCPAKLCLGVEDSVCGAPQCCDETEAEDTKYDVPLSVLSGAKHHHHHHHHHYNES